MLYNNTEIKDTVVKINLKENANIIQQNGRPIPIHLQDQVAEEVKRLIKNGYLETATEINEDCFVSPRSDNGKEGQVNKDCTRLKKIKRSNNETKSTNAKHRRIDKENQMGFKKKKKAKYT